MKKLCKWTGPAFALIFALLLCAFPACKEAGKLGKAVRATCSSELELRFASGTWKVPMCRDAAQEQINMEKIDQAVILVPGTDRNAEKQFLKLSEVLDGTGEAKEKILIQAVQFLVLRDVRRHRLDDAFLYWENGWEGWKYGYDADHPGADAVSSFEVMDSVVERVLLGNPGIRTLVIAGHSAGGQFVQRYAAGNRIENRFKGRVRFRYVVANPGSYLYFSPERGQRGSTRFASPLAPVRAGCPEYNRYKFGLEALEECDYMAETGAEALRRQYQEREVVLLLGALDTDERHAALDRSCAAELQGRNRLERGRNYYAYLKHAFGPDIVQRHHLEVVEGTGHSASAMFRSEAAKKYLFTQ